ncbi:MAG: hypothetical protein QF535_22595 [Anaerolineales bacterium]|nr:hypothetical protein [Anaerolineales bacterium]
MAKKRKSSVKQQKETKKTAVAKRKRTNTSDTLKSRTLDNCDGDVVLFQRTTSKRWQARIKRHTGIWVGFSTKETDFEKAKKVAEGRYRDIRHYQAEGKIDLTRRFSAVAQVVRRELNREARDKGIRKYRDYVLVIDRYLIPLLGRYYCHTITRDVLKEFSEKRRKMMGKVPSRSTVSTHNVALNYVLRKALDNNFIDAMPKLVMDGEGKKRRPGFDFDEYRALHNFMRKDLVRSKKLVRRGGRNGLDSITQKSYEIREILRDIVLILANTGIRTGNELLKLKWRDMEQVVDEDGMESIMFNLPHTKTMNKTGVRSVVGYESKRGKNDERYGCWKPLRRIADRFEDLKDLDWDELFEVDELVFRLPSSNEVVNQSALTRNFKILLKRCPYKNRADGLLRDSKDDERTLYSLRHTYASFRLMDGMSLERLSDVFGSSITTIEDYYKDIEVKRLAGEYSGHAKRKKEESNSELLAELERLKKEVKQLKAGKRGKA